jgi:hypothetical protein
MEKHPYSLENVGLDINSCSKLFSGNPNGQVRDVIWSELYRRSIESYSKGMTKGKFRYYCELLRPMALFLEDESRYISTTIACKPCCIYTILSTKPAHIIPNQQINDRVHFDRKTAYKREKPPSDDSFGGVLYLWGFEESLCINSLRIKKQNAYSIRISVLL